MNVSPDFCLSQIKHYDYFVLDLPATAFGFEEQMVIRLSIDYGVFDDKLYGVNVWASEPKSTTKFYICTIYVPISDHADEAIVEELNHDESFYRVICDFIELAKKHKR